jgi:uncharacterized protein
LIDTSHLIALFSTKDHFHLRAQALQQRIEQERIPLLITEQVIFELGAAFSRVAMRKTGSRIMDAMMQDPRIEVVQASAQNKQAAMDLFAKHEDKDWSLCDCMSFVIMRERGLAHALSADHHFVQAGFNALLLESDLER